MPVTRKLELHAGRPVWRRARRPGVEQSPLPARCDVLIVGSGISGALTADLLSEVGLDVTLVDRRGLVEGSSAASTALLQYEIDTPLVELTRRLGLDDAQRHYRRSKLAVRALAERVKALGFDAELQERDSLYLSGNVLDARGLEREAQARRRAGFEVELLSRRALLDRFGFSRSAALLGGGNFEANPVKLTAGFLRSASERGAKLVSHVEVKSVVENARGAVATFKDGRTVRAKWVVYCTGYELPFVLSKREHQLTSTWAISTKPQVRALWPSRCLVWEASDPYLYLRTTADGRIICGGLDEEFEDEATRDALLEKKTRALEKELHGLLPHADARAADRWTGTFGVTPLGTPRIGVLPRKRRTLAALGYGGNGFTFSFIAAQVVRAVVTGVEDPDADLYGFTAA